MLVHNHPSGNLKPSEADKDLTDRMIQACRLMEVPLLDHVIITEKSYFSFQEAGLLERLEGSNKYIPPYDLEKMSYQGGWEEGKADAIEEIAKQMLAKGLDMQLICQMTGLSTEKIQELLNSSKERI